MEETVENPVRLTVDLDDLIRRLQEMGGDRAQAGAKVGEGAGSTGSKSRQWSSALEAEDCVKVRDLLVEAGDGDVGLICKGWEADDRDVPDQLQLSIRPGKRESAKGRTALHVAARRGDVKLVRKILEITVKMERPLKDRFLGVKHREYGLDAKAMAVINGNGYIVNLLRLAASPNGYNVLDASKDADEDSFQEKEEVLRKITMEALNKIRSDKDVAQMFQEYVKKDVENARPHVGETNADSEKNEEHDRRSDPAMFYDWFRRKISYDEDCDFNFLDFQLYLFHFTFSRTFDKLGDKHRKVIRTSILSEATKDPSFLSYLLCDLKDGQGRTAAHVAVDCSGAGSSTDMAFEYFAAVYCRDDVDEDRRVKFLNISDSAGRTPLHRAAGNGNTSFLDQLSFYGLDAPIDTRVEYQDGQWGEGLDIDVLSSDNGFKSGSLWDGSDDKMTSSSALHLAVIHKCRRQVRGLVFGAVRREGFDCKRTFVVADVNAGIWNFKDEPGYKLQYLSAMQLAVLVEDAHILELLLTYCDGRGEKGAYPYKLAGEGDHLSAEKDIPSFLLAAEMGNPTLIELFLDTQGGKFDPFIIDSNGGTALHHGLKRKRIFHPHLLDFVSCQHVLSWRRQKAQDQIAQDARNLSPEDELKNQYAQRKGAVVSLLQAGIDIQTEDYDGATARPELGAPEDFVTWWYEKVVKETEEEQQSLNAAANAISVTAALVATTSYVGPLQPPLSYGGDPTGVQVQIVSVRVFFVCDTISFYLALAAIMLSLLPALPQPQQSIFKVLRRTRTLVALAVSCLFPSIMSILVAFAASSIAVAPDHGLSYHGVAVATLAVGGFICFLVIGWFADGLWNVLKTLPAAKASRRFIKRIR